MHKDVVGSAQSDEVRIGEAFEYAASGMAITDLAGHFQQSNPAYREIVRRTQAELETETILSITHPDDREECRTQLERLISGEIASFVLEKRYTRSDGESVWVRNSFSLLRDQAGQPLHIILVCNDISERRRAEALLVEREKLAIVGQLAASIAHEINNPLEAVLNLLYLVRTAETLEAAREFAMKAEEEVQRSAQIATQTLRFKKEVAEPLRVDIAELADSVLLLFKSKLARANIRLKLEKRDSPELICFPTEIRQVLANLVKNAIEAMPRGGRLRIRIRPSMKWGCDTAAVRITIADTGSGMSSEIRRRIFEPFFTTKGPRGTGLGLWVTAGIVSKHHGEVQLRSCDSPGKSGTVFSLVFPTSAVNSEG